MSVTLKQIYNFNFRNRKVNPKLKKSEHVEDDRPVAEDEGISEPETELAKLKVDLEKRDEELQTIEKEKQAAIER